MNDSWKSQPTTMLNTALFPCIWTEIFYRALFVLVYLVTVLMIFIFTQHKIYRYEQLYFNNYPSALLRLNQRRHNDTSSSFVVLIYSHSTSNTHKESMSVSNRIVFHVIVCCICPEQTVLNFLSLLVCKRQLSFEVASCHLSLTRTQFTK